MNWINLDQACKKAWCRFRFNAGEITRAEH